MSASTFNVWLITGANAGFGLLLTRLALSKGHTVIATARSLTKFPEDLRSNPKADLIELQITETGIEIAAVVDAAVARHGRLDVLVNNAGFGCIGAVEEVSEKEFRYQFNINVFGLINLTRAAIPHMRKQGSGVIANLSSGAGILGSASWSIYCSSKFAVEGLTESLAGELKPFGIRAFLINPGIFRTEFLASLAASKDLSEKKEGYADLAEALAAVSGNQAGDPQLGVERMYEAITSTGMAAGLEDQLRLVLGSDCLAMMKAKIQSYQETVDKMERIALSTDFQT